MIEAQETAPSGRTALVQKPPQKLNLDVGMPSLFLAGSIEQGVAKDWQAEVIKAFSDDRVLLLSPRRDQWDSSWRQVKEDRNFREQVTWELDAQEGAGTILMYFEPKTKSPITLLELGLFAASGKLVVCCPEGFWCKEYVDAVCERYGIPVAKDLPRLIAAAKYAVTDPEGFSTLLQKPEVVRGGIAPILFSHGIEGNQNGAWFGDAIRALSGGKTVVVDVSEGKSEPLSSDALKKRITDQEQAGNILMNFDSGSLAPSALLELGLHARSGKLVVRCAEEFWRRGNVDMVCERYGIPMVERWDQSLIPILRRSSGACGLV